MGIATQNSLANRVGRTRSKGLDGALGGGLGAGLGAGLIAGLGPRLLAVNAVACGADSQHRAGTDFECDRVEVGCVVSRTAGISLIGIAVEAHPDEDLVTIGPGTRAAQRCD